MKQLNFKTWRRCLHHNSIFYLLVNSNMAKLIFYLLVNSNMAKLLARRRRSQEEVPILPGSKLARDNLFSTFGQSKAILEEAKLILHCNTL